MYNLRLTTLNECAKIFHRGVELVPLCLISPYMCHIVQDACETFGYSRDGGEYQDAQEIIDAMLDLSTYATVQAIVWDTLDVGDQHIIDKYWAVFWTAFATALVDRAVIDGEYIAMDTTIALAYAEAIKTITEAYHAECEHKGT